MCSKTVRYTKTVYQNEADLEKGEPQSSTHHGHDFEDLSEALQYDLFSLEPGESTRPERSDEGLVVYRLDAVVDSEVSSTVPDDDQVKEMLVDQGRNAMFDAWLSDIRERARIEVLTDQ
jgi:hypothetical protein